jgi:nicotinamidase-related amidase
MDDADGGMHAESTALIVVDMQSYFCHQQSTLNRLVAEMDGDAAADYQQRVWSVVVPNLRRLIEHFRRRRSPVVFTEFGSRRPDGSDLPLWARRHNAMAREMFGQPCYLPLADAQSRVVGELAPAAGDLVVQKSTSGPLAGTDIVTRLRARNIDSAFVAGVATNVCVLGMARELADSDFDVVVVSDGCATPSPGGHEAALASLAGAFARSIDTAGALGGRHVSG